MPLQHDHDRQQGRGERCSRPFHRFSPLTVPSCGMSQRAAGYGSASRYDSAADVRPLHRQQRRRSARGSQAGLTSSQPEPRIGSPPLLGEQIFDLLQRLPPPAEWPSALLSYLVIDPLLAVTRISIDVLVSPRTHRIVLRLGVLTTLFWTGLFLAIAAYVGFYRAWVPDIGLTRAVWLQYGQSSPPYADIDLRTRTESGMGVFAPEQEYDISLDLVVPLSAANLDLGALEWMAGCDFLSRMLIETNHWLHRNRKLYDCFGAAVATQPDSVPHQQAGAYRYSCFTFAV